MYAFEFFHCNLNGFATNSAKVMTAIRLRSNVPHVVFLNETKTDEGDKIFSLEGFVKIYKGDRCKGGGGIAIFARADIAARVTLLDDTSVDERCWITIHSDGGPYVACCWYRPPKQGETESIARFRDELLEFRTTGIGTIIIGDINVHSQRWLRHSNSNSVEGTMLQNICNEVGLKQFIREPTRDKYLLDLVLSDVDLICEVGPKIADHKSIVARLEAKVQKNIVVKRTVWNYRNADWVQMQERLECTDWSFLQAMQPDDGAEKLVEIKLVIANAAIGKKQMTERKSTPPWLIERTAAAQARRDAAEGTDHEH
jgi:hypothetical protein